MLDDIFSKHLPEQAAMRARDDYKRRFDLFAEDLIAFLDELSQESLSSGEDVLISARKLANGSMNDFVAFQSAVDRYAVAASLRSVEEKAPRAWWVKP